MILTGLKITLEEIWNRFSISLEDLVIVIHYPTCWFMLSVDSDGWIHLHQVKYGKPCGVWLLPFPYVQSCFNIKPPPERTCSILTRILYQFVLIIWVHKFASKWSLICSSSDVLIANIVVNCNHLKKNKNAEWWL